MPNIPPPPEFEFLVWDSFDPSELVISSWHFEGEFPEFVAWLEGQPYIVDDTFSLDGATQTLIGLCLALLNIHIASFAKPSWTRWKNSALAGGEYDKELAAVCETLQEHIVEEVAKLAE